MGKHFQPNLLQVSMKFTVYLLAILSSLAVVFAYPYPQGLPQGLQPLAPSGDLEVSADQYAPSYSPKHADGRVKIQVYRGPSKGKGYDVFAPWGYYNTQPEDLVYG